ncbi:endonuclease/exonuclease/phosphatase family protein [Streptomyces tsukubensis]|uniref:endonuclease/exonuclease/phosphatase family protein n=1 Tax=Streptomyces tsukubensis TaxID=83656 RepID=UPI0036CBE7FE
MTTDEIRVMTFNLEHDGGPNNSDGTPPRQWTEAHKEIARHQPDILARQEMTASQSRPGDPRHEVAAADRRFAAAQRALGMKGFRAPKGLGRNPTGAFVREQTFTAAQVPHRLVWRTPPTTLTLALPELPHIPITLWSVHLAFHSRTQRQLEADNVSTALDKAKLHRDHPAGGVLVLGDMNSYAVPLGEEVPPVNWTNVTDLAHRHHRAIQQDDGTWASCVHMDTTMHNIGMHDAARWAAIRLHTPSALGPTAGKPDQGGPSRLDRVYADPWTIQSITGVKVIDMTGVSDHNAVLVTISRAKLVEALQRQTAPLAPWELINEAASM